jgi:hypothetical protein
MCVYPHIKIFLRINRFAEINGNWEGGGRSRNKRREMRLFLTVFLSSAPAYGS